MGAAASLLAAVILAAGLAACSPGHLLSTAGAGAGAAGDYQAEQLVGVTDNTLLQTFGPPTQLRREPPAEVWQYRSPACVVDFYLYRVSSVGLSVVHLEARSPVSGRLPVDSCLREL